MLRSLTFGRWPWKQQQEYNFSCSGRQTTSDKTTAVDRRRQEGLTTVTQQLWWRTAPCHCVELAASGRYLSRWTVYHCLHTQTNKKLRCRYGRLTCKNCSYLCANIHNTEFFQYSPQSYGVYWRPIGSRTWAFQRTHYWTPKIQDGWDPPSWKSTWRHFCLLRLVRFG